jgi:hypothetical protein
MGTSFLPYHIEKLSALLSFQSTSLVKDHVVRRRCDAVPLKTFIMDMQIENFAKMESC